MTARWADIIKQVVRSWNNYRGVLVFMLFYKVVFWIAVLVLAMNSTYDAYLHEAAARHQNFPWPRGSDISEWSRLATWDAGAYLLIARDGYTPHSPLCAFFLSFPPSSHRFTLSPVNGQRSFLSSSSSIVDKFSFCVGTRLRRNPYPYLGGAWVRLVFWEVRLSRTSKTRQALPSSSHHPSVSSGVTDPHHLVAVTSPLSH